MMGSYLSSNNAVATAFGPSTTNGGYSNANLGTQTLPQGFGYPVPGVDPNFDLMPAAYEGDVNLLLGYANNSAVNINYGPIPSNLGLGGLFTGRSFYGNTAPAYGNTSSAYGNTLTSGFSPVSQGNAIYGNTALGQQSSPLSSQFLQALAQKQVKAAATQPQSSILKQVLLMALLIKALRTKQQQ